MNKKKIVVLVTGGGGAGTIGIIHDLKKLDRYQVIALDASPYAVGFAFADRGYVVPFAVDPVFREVLGRIIGEEKPDFVVPLVDEEIPIVHQFVATLPEPRPLVVTPSLSFCLATLDKWQTFQMLNSVGVLTPLTWLATEADGCTFPAVIKPRDGRGSRELAYLTGPDDLAAYLARAPRSADAYVVQEQIIGREYTVSVVVAIGGPVLAVVPKEVIMKRGITQVGVTRVVPEIDSLCRDIQERLQADGPFNVQLIMREDRKPFVIEINPRYSTTVALTIASGINEVDLVIRHALGEFVQPQDFQPDLLMIRYPTQMYIPEAAWPPEHVTCSPASEVTELSERKR